MPLYFRHLRGSKHGEVETLDLDDLRIGRAEENDLKFDPYKDGEVSSRHARIYRDGTAFVIDDLHSTNGTFVNARRITQPTPLADGDVIEFSTRGPKVIFSTTPPSSGTIVVPAEPQAAQGPGSRTVALMISEALREAKGSGRGRFGSTTVFMRQLLHQAATQSSRRLRVALICLALIFVQVVGGLIYVNYRRGQQVRQMATAQAEQRNVLERQGRTQQTQQGQLSETQRIIEEQKQLLESYKNQLAQQGEQLARQQAELDRINNLVAALKQGGLDARVSERGGVTVNLPNVLFGFNSAALTEDGQQKVTRIATVVTQNAQGKRLLIEGHASRESDRSEERNQQLSEERAEAVAAALSSAGITRERITTRGFGSTRPVADNASEEGRRQNRRVEVVITAEDATTGGGS
jgi:outer membrane protein OmpA-like peptidoglycan-associated protein